MAADLERQMLLDEEKKIQAAVGMSESQGNKPDKKVAAYRIFLSAT